MKLILLLPATLFLLAGCAKPPGYYAKQSSVELCMDYLTLPSANINQSARAAELARRGEDCSVYSGAASARNKANANFERTLRSMSQQQGYGSNNYNTNSNNNIVCHKKREWTSGMNKNCVYNCLGSEYVQTVGAAQICPISINR